MLLRNVSELLSTKCRPNIQPHNDWQCGVCFVVQADDEDDALMTEDERECELCSATPGDGGSGAPGSPSTAGADDETT